MEKPWDRRRGESDKAYAAFVTYLEMPDRSIKKVVDLLSKKRQQLDEWATKFDWRDRAAAYDSSIVEAARKEKVKRQKKIIERKETIGSLMLDRAEEILRTLGSHRGTFHAAAELADIGSRLMVEALEMDGGQDDDRRELTIKIVSAEETPRD